jgi:hypothetical protein
VNTPFAAPRLAVCLTSFPSPISERPWAGGNSLALGLSADASSSTAGGTVGTVLVGAVAVVLAVFCDEALTVGEAVVPDPPQPARPDVNAATAAISLTWRRALGRSGSGLRPIA